MNHPNRAPLYKLSTHDFRFGTRPGYDIAVREDGTIRIESVNQWQGSRSGEVWIAPAPADLMRVLRGEEGDDEAPDAETLLTEWLDSDWRSTARRIRVGCIVA